MIQSRLKRKRQVAGGQWKQDVTGIFRGEKPPKTPHCGNLPDGSRKCPCKTPSAVGLQGVLLKMASESEGLRLGEVLTRATLDGLLKMASESEGLRLRRTQKNGRRNFARQYPFPQKHESLGNYFFFEAFLS